MKFIISLFTLLITVTSCDTSKKAVENNKKMRETLSGTYYITQVGSIDVSANKIAISFDATTNTVNGFAGCNSFFGNYSIEHNSISFGSIGASKKLCQKEIMSIENAVLKALRTVNSFSIDQNAVSLLENDTILIKASSTSVVSKKSTTSKDTYKTAVKYQASTRGSFDFILISQNGISISKDAGLQDIEKHAIDAAQWKELKTLIEDVDVESLQELKAPSQKHQYDGALHATLAIQIGDVEYITPTFDHGNPPSEIETLVNKVLSIKEKTIKQ
ncbi:META domain-containing protein [Winogradskyella sp. F6397]|uniref:META domain-containing protein n=1 Tax=Winogradskyella marina TaxID=2785530 RepID=A0ABS0EFI9_9FLAO|nr:META domain-containing protein [Winogradskyella marina]MBF8149219.1 META domain-containing protein [Winogradskyella marina]